MSIRDRTNYRPTGSIDPNRANMVRRDDDTVGNIYVGLYDIDNAIKYYFDNVIQPKYGEEARPVPVMYGSPERWKAVQRDGYIRDKKGVLQYPLIMYKRTNIEKVRDLSRNLDANNPHLFQTIEKKYTPRNRYDRFSKLTNVQPQREFYNVIVPDYVTLQYECVIWTDFVEDMNKLIEAINYAAGAYWGDMTTFKFYAEIDSYSQTQTVEVGEDRLVKAEFTLSVKGYIVPDAMQARIKQASQKSFNYSQIQVNFNPVEQIVTEGDPLIPISNELEETTGDDTPIYNRGRVSGDIYAGALQSDLTAQSEASGVSTTTLLYLENVTSKIATPSLTTDTTATFENTSMAIPSAGSGLPTQDKDDFRFFVNGQYIPSDYIISFVASGLNMVVTMDITELGYNLEGHFTISAIGRFA